MSSEHARGGYLLPRKNILTSQGTVSLDAVAMYTGGLMVIFIPKARVVGPARRVDMVDALSRDSAPIIHMQLAQLITRLLNESAGIFMPTPIIAAFSSRAAPPVPLGKCGLTVARVLLTVDVGR